MKPFLLFLVITVMNPDGGVDVTADRFYVPSIYDCELVKKQLEAEHTWEAYYRGVTITRSTAKVTCVPMRGVQYMPGDKNND